MTQINVSIRLREPFDEQVALLVTDLAQAAAEGEQHLDELLAALPARIRRIFRQSVVARAERRNPPELGSIEGSSVSPAPSFAEESSTGSRAGRPLGLSTLQRKLFIEESACPLFTKLRLDLGLSRSGLAAAALAAGYSISKSTICNLELGATVPSRSHAEALAAAIGLSVEAAYSLLRNEDPVNHLVAI